MKNHAVKIRSTYVDMPIIPFVIYMDINTGVTHSSFYWSK